MQNDNDDDGDGGDDEDKDDEDDDISTLQPAQQCGGGRKVRNHQLRFAGSPGGINPCILFIIVMIVIIIFFCLSYFYG